MLTARAADDVEKKIYLRPQVFNYGDLRTMTQSGVGSKTENIDRLKGSLKICAVDATKSKC